MWSSDIQCKQHILFYLGDYCRHGELSEKITINDWFIKAGFDWVPLTIKIFFSDIMKNKHGQNKHISLSFTDCYNVFQLEKWRMNLLSSMLIDNSDKNKRPRQECIKTYMSTTLPSYPVKEGSCPWEDLCVNVSMILFVLFQDSNYTMCK